MILKKIFAGLILSVFLLNNANAWIGLIAENGDILNISKWNQLVETKIGTGNIVGGTNVTLSNSGNIITINSTGGGSGSGLSPYITTTTAQIFDTGTTGNIIIDGKYFDYNSTVQISDPNFNGTINSITNVSTTRIIANISVGTNAGNYKIEVGNGGGISSNWPGNGSNLLIINTAAAGTFALTPTTVNLGSTSNVTNNCSTSPTSYISSNTSVATISGNTITGVGVGITNITPVGGNCLDNNSKLLTINPSASGTFSFSPTTIDVGSSSTITNNCETAPTSYISADTSIATISGNTITAVSDGTVNITPTGGNCADNNAKILTINPAILTKNYPMDNNYQDTLGVVNWSVGATQTAVNPDWSFNSGATSSSSTGPSGPQEGTHYLYTETSSSNANKTFILENDLVANNMIRPINMSFYYHMYGANMGELKIQEYVDGSWLDVWTITGQQHTATTDAWTKTPDISLSQSATKIRFHYTSGTSFTGDLGIDNIVLNYYGGTLTKFDLVSTDMIEGNSANITNNCTISPTSYISSNTSVATISGNTVTGVGAGSTNITSVGGDCIDNSPIVLNVTTTTFILNVSITSIGNTSSITNNCTTSPTSYISSNTSVATISGNTITALSNGTSNITPVGGNCINNNLKVFTVTSVPSSKTYLLNNNYEDTSGTVGWSVDTSQTAGNPDWGFEIDETGSSSTGPSVPQEGTHYLYTETSSPNYTNKTFILENDFNISNITNAISMNFYYHRYGVSMGELKVQEYIGGFWSDIWTITGAQHTATTDAWIKTPDINISQSATKIRFYYTSGSSYTGDMGIDNVVINNY